MDLPCTNDSGSNVDQYAYAGPLEPPSGRPQCSVRRWLGPIPQEQHQHADLAGLKHHQRRREVMSSDAY